ncbi:MAG: choline ABC transporter substrate-binding protein [Methylophilales bacterium]|nr:choline ABC transporter substrate-binding protein [Methylophilales bacterium]
MNKLAKSVLIATLFSLVLTACGKKDEAAAPEAAASASGAACSTVKFADIGWTDITATTAISSVVLEGLGYKAESTIASVPIAFAGVKKSQIDVFLGYWSPSMTPIVDPFLKEKAITVLDKPNLVGAKYTLAVPKYAYDAGLKSFADIAKFSKELDGKIYGIEPGNDGNKLIADMISKDAFGLKSFKMVESSEAGMLTEVSRSVKDKKWIVFLGWAPHPMNVQQDIVYLSGGDDFFGPNYGEAKVYTVVANDLATRCPNVSKFITNLEFSVGMENEVMLPIMDKKAPNEAAKEWLAKNPGVLDKWLDGVTTMDGQSGLDAVKKHLGV